MGQDEWWGDPTWVCQLHELAAGVNRRILEQYSPPEVFRYLVDFLVDRFGVPLAWVGLKETEGTVRWPTAAGPARTYLDNITVRWDDTPEGRGPTGKAIRTGSSVSALIETDPDFEPWRAPALRHGLKSSLAVPLCANRDTMGALCLYACEATFFTKDRIWALERLGDQLALSMLRSQELEQLRTSERHLRQAERIGKMGHWTWWPESGQFHWSDQAYCLFGLEPNDAQVSYELFRGHVHPDDGEGVERALKWSLESGEPGQRTFRIVRQDGQQRWMEGRWAIERTPDGRLLNGIIRDVTEQKRYEEQLEYRALHDQLTDLPNRALYRDRVEQAVARIERNSGSVGVLFLDLQRFKVINDTLGYTIGDRVLIEVGRRLVRTLRGADTVARVGGDEFVVVVQDLPSPKALETLAQRVMDVLVEPVMIYPERVSVEASIGGAVVSDGGEDGTLQPADASDIADELLRRADQGMYLAKARPGSAFAWYDRRSDFGQLDQLQREEALRRAVEDDAFAVHFQPIVALASGRIVGAEALARWTDSEGVQVSPAEFIPLAEEIGLIGELSDQILRKACLYAREWPDVETQPLALHLNLSPVDVEDPNVVERLLASVKGVDGCPLTCRLEVTEGTLLRSPERLDEIKAHGFEFTVDDFGTGRASLHYLKDLPIDGLKLAMDFVHGIGVCHASEAIVRTVITLAEELNLSLIVEGIETPEQLRFLQDAGRQAMYGQGFYFTRPLPPEEFLQLLAQDPVW